MITAARIRECHGVDGVLALLRDLGYPVEPVPVGPVQWQRAGIELPWNGTSSFLLAARVGRFDLFVLDDEDVDDAAVAKFLRSYHAYNVLTKSSLVFHDRASTRIAIYDLAPSRELRRLDVDLAAPSVHALDRLNLLAARNVDPAALPRLFDRALDREQVTRQFFERFRNAVREVGRALAEAHPDETLESTSSEALLLLSRLLFLSFIQEKGWLAGERRFLIDRLEQSMREGREFFADVLLPLFFGCLNTAAAQRDDAARALGAIPYLNGGLFEPSPFELRHPALTLPNQLLQRVLEDVFERFDFRIDEGDAAGTHVDPEMLGRVFESLMAADERAASGSFYTPKEIVDALTSRAIEQWLGGAMLDAADELAPEVAHRLLERLSGITILDPACGSGAFLLSALGVVERLHRALATTAGVAVPANLRQQIVERSLYGVDLKPEAVRLCELRLWLAIVSTTDASIDAIAPLPNLDRNILQGNALLSPTDFLGDGRGDIYRQWVYALRAQRDAIERYRRAPAAERPALNRLLRANDLRLASELLSKAIDADEGELQLLVAPQRDLFGRALPPDHARCRELHDRIREHRRTLERVEEGTLDFFSFDVHFAHVIAAGGFDVVAGNPPWVRNSRIDPRAKRMYSDRYHLFRASGHDGAAFHQPDLSIVFFERALSLAAPDGVVSLLLPAKMLNAAYAAPLRAAAEKLTLLDLADWSDGRWFEADTFPLGVVATKARRQRHRVRVTTCGETFELAQSDLSFGGEWALVPSDAGAILRRLRATHEPLAKTLTRQPVMGVKSGDNRLFFLEGATLRGDRLITSEGIRIPLEAVCRIARGRDVMRWSVRSTEWMLWPPRNGWTKPPRWLTKLATARGASTEDFRLAYVRPEHVGLKVVWKDLSRGMAAAVLGDVLELDGRVVPLVPNQTLYSVDAASPDEAHVIAALLNSTVAGALLLCLVERAKDAHFRYFGRTVARLPLPRVDPQSPAFETLARMARRAQLGGNVDDELDALVAALYGLSSEELTILRRFVAQRLEREE